MVYSPTMPTMKLTAADMGVPDYMNALRQGFQGAADVYKPKKAAEDLLAQALSNKINRPKAENAEEWFRSELNKNNASTGLSGAQTNYYSAQVEKMLQQNAENRLFNQMLNGGVNEGYENAPSNIPDMHNAPITIPRSPSGGMQSSVPALAADNSGNQNVSYEGPGVAASTSVHDTFPGRFKNRGVAPAEEEGSTVLPDYARNLNAVSNPGNAENRSSTILSPGDPSKEYLNKMYDSNIRFRKAMEDRGLTKKTSIHTNAGTGETSVITQWPNGKITSQTSTTSASGGPSATPASKTAQQSIVINAPKVNRLIDKIIESPSPATSAFYRPAAKKQHSALVTEAAETLVKARSWPNTKGSIDKAETILERGWFESDSAYRKRLEGLKNEMSTNVEEANNFLSPGNKKSSSNSKSNSNIVEWTRDANGKPIRKK
jgi:hypothetical protein